MITRPTIIMFIAALLGIAAMLIVARRDAHVDRSAVKETGRLFAAAQLPIEAVTRITLKRGAEPAMVFERTGALWNQTQPFHHPMDAFSMRQFSTNARELTAIDSIDPDDLKNGLTLASLQLQAGGPAGEITYHWPEGSLTLQLGRRSVAGRAYLRYTGDETIHVVDSKLHERALETDPKEWRDRTLFHNVGVESTRIESEQGAGVRIALVRERKQWKMLEPAQTRVDPNGRDVYLQDLGRAVAAGFVLDQPSEADLAKFGLTSAVATLTVTTSPTGADARPVPATAPTGAGETQRLIIGSRTGANSQDRFGLIEGRPVVMKVSKAALEALFRLPKDLADPVASGTPAADVKSIVIRSDGKELRLERDLEIWRAPDRNNAVVNSAFVQELLDQLTKLRAPTVEFKTYPQELEIGTVTLHGYDGKAIDTIRIAKDKDTGKLALENGDNVLRVFSPAVKIRMTAEDFGLDGKN